jgi:hypothetical protein
LFGLAFAIEENSEKTKNFLRGILHLINFKSSYAFEQLRKHVSQKGEN